MGGPAKSQLVHEVDALGGEIGKMADRTYVQKRVLNRSKASISTAGPQTRELNPSSTSTLKKRACVISAMSGLFRLNPRGNLTQSHVWHQFAAFTTPFASAVIPCCT